MPLDDPLHDRQAHPAPIPVPVRPPENVEDHPLILRRHPDPHMNVVELQTSGQGDKLARAHSFLSMAEGNIELVFTRLLELLAVTLRGPVTRGTVVECPPNGEWLAIYFQETRIPKEPPPPAPKEAPKESPKAATPSGTPGQTGPDAAANEKLVWDALKSGNFDAFASYLAADSINIEPDGVYDKSGSVKDVSMMDSSKAELSDWKTLKLDDDASLVTYTVKLPGMGTEYHSTIWVRRDGKWLALFHQGTPAMPPPAAKPEAKKM